MVYIYFSDCLLANSDVSLSDERHIVREGEIQIGETLATSWPFGMGDQPLLIHRPHLVLFKLNKNNENKMGQGQAKVLK
jgi:hypothetical protein